MSSGLHASADVGSGRAPASKRNGHHSSPTASWKARRPRPRAATSAARSARHARVRGVAPRQRLGQERSWPRPAARAPRPRDREVGRGPDHAFGLAAQRGVAARRRSTLAKRTAPSGPLRRHVVTPRHEPVGERGSPARRELLELGRRRRAASERVGHGVQGRGRGSPGQRLPSRRHRGGCSARAERRDTVRGGGDHALGRHGRRDRRRFRRRRARPPPSARPRRAPRCS